MKKTTVGPTFLTRKHSKVFLLLLLMSLSFCDRDMYMRYQWGYAVGHTYSHRSNMVSSLTPAGLVGIKTVTPPLVPHQAASAPGGTGATPPTSEVVAEMQTILIVGLTHLDASSLSTDPFGFIGSTRISRATGTRSRPGG